MTWVLGERPEPVRFLLRDNDRKFTRSFDEVFQDAGIRIVRTPIQAPQANGVAERFVRTARSECLDWLLILNARHLERVLARESQNEVPELTTRRPSPSSTTLRPAPGDQPPMPIEQGRRLDNE